MRKQLKIEFEGGWVLQHRFDDELPVETIKNILKKLDGVEVCESSLTVLKLEFDDGKLDVNNLESKVVEIFRTEYPEDNVNEIIEFESADAEAKQNLCESSSSSDGDDGDGENDYDADWDSEDEATRRRKIYESILGGMSQEAESARNTDGINNRNVLDEINALVGAAEFKQLAREIADIAPEIKRKNTYAIFTNRCYLFSIGDGCGLSTYLDLLTKLISGCGIVNTGAVFEAKLGAYKEDEEPFANVYKILYYGNKKTVKILCVDISEWINKTDARPFKEFLRNVERHAEEFIVIFRVPFVDKDILEKLRFSLGDLLTVKAVSFPPFGVEEIKACAAAELKKYGFTVTKSAWKYFFGRISEEKSDGKFYGLNTVKKVVRELIYNKQLDNAVKGKTGDSINQGDAKSLCGNSAQLDLSGEEQLNKLIGSENIKSRIDEILAQIELSLKGGGVERPCIHMRFVGNPGTGKTTVARIIGKILKEKGILRVGNFFEYSGRDLCGRYIGETAPKTAGICRDAYGSVLFIDEAYSLYRGDDNDRDYGREAIDTLIAEMENHRNDLVVIMAGYTDDMEKLMGGNLGLASRMPYTLEFPNFTREQLFEIFRSMVNGKFGHDKYILDDAREYFMSLPEDFITAKEFSNARFVRNLFERTWAKAAMRCQLSQKQSVVLTREDFALANKDNEFALNVKKTKIGFNN